MSRDVYDRAFYDRAMRESLAQLLARLTYDDDSNGPSAHYLRWSQRIKRTRNLQRLRFSSTGVHLANNVLIRWQENVLPILPRLPEVLTAARDYATAALESASAADVAGATDALVSRGVAPPSPFGEDGRVWWRSCPREGSPSCTYGDKPASPYCDYCHGDGFLAEPYAPSLAHFIGLYARGDLATRAENVAQEFFASRGVRIDRVAWCVWTKAAYDTEYRRGRFGCERNTLEGAIVAGTARWITHGEERNERPMLRDLDEMNVHLLDAHGNTVVLGVERL